ncbi:hypothetical protein [Streptomyces beigongshangae]|nr:hypothetical protein [Streptomyces sp. REN17]
MHESDDWSDLAYKGLGGLPIGVVIALLVLGLVYAAVAASRRNRKRA